MAEVVLVAVERVAEVAAILLVTEEDPAVVMAAAALALVAAMAAVVGVARMAMAPVIGGDVLGTLPLLAGVLPSRQEGVAMAATKTMATIHQDIAVGTVALTLGRLILGVPPFSEGD